jgi:uncharacterized protein YegL
MTNYERRLPIYLLLDCSESMAGEAFNAMKKGLEAMIKELRTDPMALDLAALSVITFASSARQLMPLTELARFNIPTLRLGSGTALGAALDLLEKSINQDVRKTSKDFKGDYKPIVFILTDGEPTDKWEKTADRINNNISGKTANIICIGCGPDADIEKLRRITGTVVAMKDLDEDSFSKFFKWVSASVSTASQGLEVAGDQGVRLPDLPDECLEVAGKRESRDAPMSDRYIFLHVKCEKNKSFYIARYAKQTKSGSDLRSNLYQGVAGHPVDDFDFDEVSGGKELKIKVENLGVPPACPYCKNSWLAVCQCGKIHCSPIVQRTINLTCPWCGTTSTYAPAGNMDIGRGRG